MPWIETDDGVELDPPLQLIDKQALTLAQMQEGCLLMGIDPDAVLRGGTAQIPDMPPWPQVHEMFELVVENADTYDLDSWPVGRVRAVLAQVVAHFAQA